MRPASRAAIALPWTTRRSSASSTRCVGSDGIAARKRPQRERALRGSLDRHRVRDIERSAARAGAARRDAPRSRCSRPRSRASARMYVPPLHVIRAVELVAVAREISHSMHGHARRRQLERLRRGAPRRTRAFRRPVFAEYAGGI